MSTTLNALQKQRRDTAANWTTANPTLLAGEIGIESDTSKIKIGDGSTAWNSLGYTPWSQVSAYPIVNADVASNAEIAVSKLADGTARQLLQTDAAGTGVEWTSNVDVPGTLDVTGAATFDNNVTIQGDLTVNGTTTTIDTTNLAIEDKNIEIGKVATPTDVTADGGGITLKGTTDKTISWVDATDAWTLSEHVSIASGKEYRINGTKVLDATSLGSGVLITSSNITDGTIVNADINASAAIAGTKISPDFGSQNTTTTGTVTGASLIPSSSTAPSNGVYLPAANTVGISTASTERIRIGSAGQIGIGGANYGTSGQVLTSNGSGAAPSWQSSVSQWTTSGSNIYYSTGSVGIGTTSPSEAFTLGSGNAQITSGQLTVGVTSTSGLQFINDGTFGTLNSIPLVLRTASAERVRIDTSGRVGIGTATPGSYSSAFDDLVIANAADGGITIVSSNTSSGTVAFADGTTGTEQYRGFIQYGHASDALLIGTGGAERVRIDSSGRVGIGTSSPGRPLDVTGVIQSQSSSTSGGLFYGLYTGTTAGSQLGNLNFYGNGAGVTAETAVRGILDTGSTTAAYLTFSTTPSAGSLTERVRIDSSGRVGIGNTAPGHFVGNVNLVVGSAATSTTNAGVTLYSGTATYGGVYFADGTVGDQLYRGAVEYKHDVDALALYSGGSEKARIDSSGRLLLGTSTARTNLYNSTISSQFQIEGTGVTDRVMSVISSASSDAPPCFVLGKQKSGSIGGNTIIASGDGLGVISFQGNDGSEFVEAANISAQVDGTPGANDMPGRLVFSVTADGASSPTEAMRISNNRNVRFGTSGTSYGMFDINNDGSSTYKLEYTNVSSTRVFGVTSGGIVESKGSYDSVTVSAANAFLNATTYQLQRSTSSIKYKKDVETIEDRYSDALLQCRPVWYRSKCENDNPAWGHWGFIAEEVAEIDPRLCHYGKDENGADVIESVQYDRFVPHLLNLIKRQQQAIEALEARISALETQ